jgi:hypothetical protein
MARAELPIRASVGDLSWLPGRWVGDHGEDWIEETWGPAHGFGMVGMFRAVRYGEPRFYELIVMDTEGGGVVCRFRHFDREMVGWEERGDPLVLDLVALTGTEAVFLRRGMRRWMTYRHDPPDRLTVFFEAEDEAHDPDEEYRFGRA